MKNSLIYKLYKRVNAKCKEKTGSTLLMVVMTMSVLIIIGSSFMVLSQNSALDGIFASSQVKAEQTALSVANTLKAGAISDLIDDYMSEIMSAYQTGIVNGTGDNPGHDIVLRNDKLPGQTVINLKAALVYAGALKQVKVTISTTVGKKTETLTFMSNSVKNSVNDVVNSVTNAFSVSGGGSYSFATGGINGDLSFDGDYLLALVNKDGGSGTVNGNVFVNGSLVLGVNYKNPNDSSIPVRGISTIIEDNLYVNGDLIINSTFIKGDVYVSGNILFNGVIPSDATIQGNVYCGGNFFVSGTPFKKYMTVANSTTGDAGDLIYTGYKLANPAETFASFPTLDEIKSASALFQSYNLLIKDVSLDGGNIKVTHLDDSFQYYSANPYIGWKAADKGNIIDGTGPLGLGLHDNDDDAVYWQGIDQGWQVDGVMIIRNERAGNQKGINGGGEEVKSPWRTYDAIWSVANGNEQISKVLEKYIKEVVTPYVSQSIFAERISGGANHSLTVKGNIYAQGNAYVEATDTLATAYGKTFYTCGDFEFASGKIASAMYGSAYSGASDFTTTRLYAKSATKLGNVNEVGFSSIGGNSLFWAYAVGEATIESREGRWDGRKFPIGYYSLKYDIGPGTACNQGMYGDHWESLDTFKKNYSGNRVKTIRFKTPDVNVMVYQEDSEMPKQGNSLDLDNIAFAGTDGRAMYNEDYLDMIQDDTLFDCQTKENPDTIADVFREMGIYKVDVNNATLESITTGEIFTPAHMSGVFTAGRFLVNGEAADGAASYLDPFYYGKHFDSSNKSNDRKGINFTGVTSATQIKMGYTLAKALSNKIIVTGGKGFYEASGGDYSGAIDDDWIFFKDYDEYGHNLNTIKNPEEMTYGNTLYGRMLYIGDYSYNAVRSNNFSDTWRGQVEGPRKSARQADVRYLMERLHQEWNNDVDNNWDKYVGIVCIDESNKVRAYLMRDIYCDGGSDWTFRNEYLLLDTSYGNIHFYIRSENGKFVLGDGSDGGQGRIENSLIVPEASNNKLNIAYVYLIPNYKEKTSITAMNSEQLRQNVNDILAKGSEKYEYVEYSYPEVRKNASGSGKNFSYFAWIRTDSTFRNVRNATYNATSLPFLLCEASTIVRLDNRTEVTGIIYTPHPDSEVYIASIGSLGTGSSNASHDYIVGGAIVTGTITGLNGSNSKWNYIENGYLGGDEIADLLTEAIMDSSGLGDIETSGGSESSSDWQSGDFI